MAQPYSDASVDAFVKHQLKKPLDCIIVGSGVSGLTTASLLVQAGISVLVLERSAQAGGATHGFKESGFDFEIGLQEVGSQIWLGTESKDPYSLPLTQACNGLVEWKKFDGGKSYVVHFGSNVDEFPVRDTWEAFRRDLVEKFPAEQAAVDKFRELVAETRKCGVDWILSRLPNHTVKSSSWLFSRNHGAEKGSKQGAVENIERFRALALKTVDQVFDEEITCSQELRYLLTFLWAKMGLPPRVGSWGAFALLVGQFMFDGLAFPVGGAPALERAMIQVIERSKLGKCLVDCKVQRILCESNVCVGVQLESGKELRAAKVVSSIGAVNTYERLVPVTMAEYVRVPIKALKELKYSSYSVLQVFYGFEGNSAQLGLTSATHWFLPSSSSVNDHTDNAVRYLLDPSFSAPFPYVHVSFPSAKQQDANSNKSTAVVFAAAHYDWFKGMQPDDIERCAEEIVSRLSKQLFERFPQLTDKIRFAELATPLSLEFHLGSNRGAMLGLGHSPSRFEQEWLRPQSPIKNLVLGGQDILTASVVNSSVGGYMAARTAFPGEMLKHFPNLL